MCSRCNNLNHPRYADWGGRGITVSERWQGWFGFDNFLADMGSRPPGTTLERLDNDGNYGPDNCCWATVAQQNRNKRSTKLTTEVILEIERLLDGGTSLKVIAEATGINRHSVGTVATTIQALRSEHP
jgi:hypothetical protein